MNDMVKNEVPTEYKVEPLSGGLMVVPREMSDEEVMKRAEKIMYAKLEKKVQFGSNSDAARFFHAKLANRDREFFGVMYLDCQMRLLKYDEPFAGGLTNCMTSPRVLAKEALMLGASNIVISHNHPSGNPQPSPEDKAMTVNLGMALKLLEINLLDHIVVGREGDVSMASEGLV